jgi:general secretion pathway protein A
VYAPFFGLRQEPFSIAPDPRYLYMSERHREALAHLLYGVNGGGGFVLLTGEIGAGKTTVCRCFLEQVPKRTHVAYVFNPALSVIELLQTVCDEFRIPVAPHAGAVVATVKDHVDALNRFLLETHAVGQNSVLIIDEAQSVSAEVLEQLRLLTNLETTERKLLQIMLIGQPELRTMLAQPELEQVAQRVIARYHLDALSEAETRRYIRHRLTVAGARGANPFSRDAMVRIHALARGIPRRINLIADRALLGAYASGRNEVDTAVVDKAAAEVLDLPAMTPAPPRRRMALAGVLGAAGGAALLAASWWAMEVARRGPDASPPAAAAAAASAAASAPPAAAAASMPSPAASAPVALADPRALLAALPRQERAAWAEIAAGWKINPEGDDPCTAALREQVHCFRGNGNAALLRQLGRPAILSLRDDSGRAAYAPLVGWAGETVTLRIGGAAQTLPWPLLERQWRGEFATFWRVPPGYEPPLVASRTGEAGRWVASQLARLPGGTPGEPLRAQVVAFQTAQGLPVDGLAGPITLMQLNRVAGIDEPRLAPLQ